MRLLPEFDALLLAYDAAARDRFAAAAALSYTWIPANGVHAPTGWSTVASAGRGGVTVGEARP